MDTVRVRVETNGELFVCVSPYSIQVSQLVLAVDLVDRCADCIDGQSRWISHCRCVVSPALDVGKNILRVYLAAVIRLQQHDCIIGRVSENLGIEEPNLGARFVQCGGTAGRPSTQVCTGRDDKGSQQADSQ